MNFVCLACSHRPGGRCIAGIDLDTGRWVRPVPPVNDAIEESRCRLKGAMLAPLDVLKIPTRPLPAPPRYQRENVMIQNWSWAAVGRLTAAQLDPFVEESGPVLHSAADRVVPSALETLPFELWKSLQLVRPRGLTFVADRRNSDPWSVNRYRARFRDATGAEQLLMVTDPLVTKRLDKGESFSDNVLLTVSLTKPYAAASGLPPMCYKIVAAVIEC